jgi:hypothetical protein
MIEIQTARRQNPRVPLTQIESAAVDQSLKSSQDRLRQSGATTYDIERIKLKRALNAATRELISRDEVHALALRKRLSEQTGPMLANLKLPSGLFAELSSEVDLALHSGDHISLDHAYAHFNQLRPKFRPFEPLPAFTDPPFARELWWGETRSFWSGGLSVDIDNDPNRIWGHIAYDNDNLFSGSVGISMFFFLTPDRFPALGGNSFEIRPQPRISGWVSGWTGLYHPIWAADDKWSKCWQNLSATASLTTGEILATDNHNFNLFFLEDEYGVGQGNASVTMGWSPILRFNANLRDLRARGVSIMLEVQLRYDYQLEGESDLWIRHRPGSNAESVPAFDNAVTFRVAPGSVLSV